jgi:hypothetical protein
MHAPGDSGLFCESDVSGRDVALAAVRIGNAFPRKGFVSKIVLPPSTSHRGQWRAPATGRGDGSGIGISDQSLLMSFSAANWASNSEAKSSGVTTLRTLSPPTGSNRRIFGIMAARQCPGLRRYVTIENSETFAIDRLGGQIFACYGAMSTAC